MTTDPDYDRTLERRLGESNRCQFRGGVLSASRNVVHLAVNHAPPGLGVPLQRVEVVTLSLERLNGWERDAIAALEVGERLAVSAYWYGGGLTVADWEHEGRYLTG